MSTVAPEDPEVAERVREAHRPARSQAADATLRELAERMRSPAPATGEPVVGVDLGTACIVVVAADQSGAPLGAALRFADVVRDGLLVDYPGAVEIVRDLVDQVERGIGAPLRCAAAAYPPGVSEADAAPVRHVVEAAGLEVRRLVEEPVAANEVLEITDGALVDVGGGTTGIAIYRDGRLVHIADEPTGGTHLSLAVAGALGISVEAADERKRDPSHQTELLPVVRPVIEKISSIISTHIAGHGVRAIHLAGGTCAFTGFDRVVEETIGMPASLPSHPLLVTPLGIALSRDREARHG